MSGTLSEKNIVFEKRQALKKAYQSIESSLGVGIRIERLLQTISCFHDVEATGLDEFELVRIGNALANIELQTDLISKEIKHK